MTITWKILFILLTLTALPLSGAPYVNASGKAARFGGIYDSRIVNVPADYRARSGEWRAVWIATVFNIDMPQCRTPEEFQKEFNSILKTVGALRFNTVIFQVRSNCDAFYPSKHNPWSRWLTGREGRGFKGFDPLKWMIKRTHDEGMEFHAWLNPFRVVGDTKLTKSAYLKTLDPGNYARRHPDHVLDIDLGNGRRQLILDPGRPEVRRHIIDTVTELVKNYDIDAVHFDDYFYPYDGLKNQDSATFRRFGGKLRLADWRRNNVNSVIKGVSETIKTSARNHRRPPMFGVSPFGIWANRSSTRLGSYTGGKECLNTLYADVRKWMHEKWIDYVAPQIYWEFHHEKAAYAALVDWWVREARGTGVKLWIGQGAHRIGNRHPEGELAAKLRYDSHISGISGEAIFSCNVLTRPSGKIQERGVSEVLKKYWKTRVLPPPRK